MSALLYLLASNAGMSDPATVAANSACWACISDKWAAALYLLDNGGSGGGGGSGSGVTCGSGAPVAAPSSGCGIYLDTDTNALYVYTNGAWTLKV